MKILILLLFIPSAFALEFNWLGTTTITLRHKDNIIMFDPYITHVSLWETISNAKVDSNKETVDYWLNKAGINKMDALFVNHAHYDHILDLGTIAKKFNAAVYGSQSAINFGFANGATKGEVVNDKKSVQVGSMQVISIKAMHTPHVLNYIFFDGKIEKPLPLPAPSWELKKGDDFIYYIKTDQGNILFHPFAWKSPHYESYKEFKADYLFLGIATRKSTQDQIDTIINDVDPKVIIPMHYDDFFADLEENPSHLPTMNLDEWMETLKEKKPGIKTLEPKVSKWFNLPAIAEGR